MPEDLPTPTTILHVRPSDPRRSAIVEYADHFRRALDRIPDAAAVDFLPSDLTEKIDSHADCEAVKKYVARLAAPYQKWKAPVIVHVEEGNSLHREFWAGVFLRKLLPKARFFCTVHDPPTLCSNPLRHVHTEFEGKTPVRFCNVALTKGAETTVRWLKRRVEKRFVRHCDGVLVLKDGGLNALRGHPLFQGANLQRLNHVFSFDSLGARPAGPDAKQKTDDSSNLTVVFFGFIGPDKGLEDLLDAFEILTGRLEKEGAPCKPRLKIFGAAAPTAAGKSHVEEIRRRAAQLSRPETVDFSPGYVERDERDRRLAEADVMVLPFRPVETVQFSSAGLIRAMGLGKALVASRTGTVEEEITDGETGLLFNASDPGGLAECLHHLALDAPLRRRLGQNAQRHIRAEHSEQAVADRLAGIYGMGE